MNDESKRLTRRVREYLARHGGKAGRRRWDHHGPRTPAQAEARATRTWPEFVSEIDDYVAAMENLIAGVELERHDVERARYGYVDSIQEIQRASRPGTLHADYLVSAKSYVMLLERVLEGGKTHETELAAARRYYQETRYATLGD